MVQLRQDVEVAPLQVAQELSQDAQVCVWEFPYVPTGHVLTQVF